MSKLKVAVVGCGFVAQKRHMPSFHRLRRDVSVYAVCDLNHNLAREVARKFGIPNVYSNISEMLSKKDFDVVDVCTPPKIHAPIAIEAMESGCHVLLEKPMAANVSDCDKMIRASQKYGVRLSVVHNQRFYPPFLKAQELVDSGAIGKLTSMRILSLTHRAEYIAHENHWIHKLPGGVLGETGPHVVYLSLAFLKNVKDVELCAKKTVEYPWVLYDNYNIELEGENINSSIIISHANDCTAFDVDLFGTRGTIKIDLQSMLSIKYRREDLTPMSVALSSLSVSGQMVKGILGNAPRAILHRPMLGHEIMIEKFIESLIIDQPVPVTAEEGRETVRVLETIVSELGQKYANSELSSKRGQD